MIRRTKVIATLGPSTDDPAELKRLLEAGVDLVRMNYSHGTAEDHLRRIKAVRAQAAELGKEVGVLADLQGPKIRIGSFKTGSVALQAGAEFILDNEFSLSDGNANCVGLTYKGLVKDVSAGDKLLLDDGRLVFQVKKVSGSQIVCLVEVGGTLSNNKGINRLGGGLSAETLTEKDKQDLVHAVAAGVDYFAISFVRCAADVEQARALVRDAGSEAGIIAKIERVEAVEACESIIQAADAVMVARGDLGVEIGDAELLGVQKRLIHQSRRLDKAVITATQMMESMVHNSIPTRAEVMDVANAVLDSTDAVMLSQETATGDHPHKVVEAMVRICLGAEKERIAQVSRHRVECQFERCDEAIAMAAMYAANHMNISAIVALTESGTTPLWMSRIRTAIPIYGLSRHEATRRKMTLFRGVYPLNFDATQFQRDAIHRASIQALQDAGCVENGDLVIITKGDVIGTEGGANAMKIVEVGKVA